MKPYPILKTLSNIGLQIKNGLDRSGNRISEDGLLTFDHRVIALFLACIISFILLVSFKISGSSVSMWDHLLTDKKDFQDKNIIFGAPNACRSDEWAVTTPFILSQAACNFPVENKSLGAGKTPIVISLPARHYSTLFRPQNWGFFSWIRREATLFFGTLRSLRYSLASFCY
jgi:hypothetical protein